MTGSINQSEYSRILADVLTFLTSHGSLGAHFHPVHLIMQATHFSREATSSRYFTLLSLRYSRAFSLAASESLQQPLHQDQEPR